tara:strand:- start:208 stop:669 length:462 start_codon:yes stop_codon:yes gene_type:complete
MKIFIKLIFILFITTNILKADLIKPEPALKPLDVLLIQLNSLKNNNTPYLDAGIEQTWEFAHPNNKKMTGPLEKFKQMIYGESYKILISHESSEVIILKETKNTSLFKVIILSKNKKKYYYIWQVEKVLFEGSLKNCWMTTNVSNPNFLGDVI